MLKHRLGLCLRGGEHRRTTRPPTAPPLAGQGSGLPRGAASAVTMATAVGPARRRLSHAALRSAVHCGPGKMAASWLRCWGESRCRRRGSLLPSALRCPLLPRLSPIRSRPAGARGSAEPPWAGRGSRRSERGARGAKGARGGPGPAGSSALRGAALCPWPSSAHSAALRPPRAGPGAAAPSVPGALASMESELLQSPLLGLGEEDESDLTDWNLPLAFMKKRHCEKIEGSKSLAQSWRMKDRVMAEGGRGTGREGGGPPVPHRGCERSACRVIRFVCLPCVAGAADRWETHREPCWVPSDSGNAMTNMYPGSQQHAVWISPSFELSKWSWLFFSEGN